MNILPGGAFGCPEPGWFRICHATDPAVVWEGITRLGHQLSSLSARHVQGMSAGHSHA